MSDASYLEAEKPASGIQLIPLNRLSVSKLNVRRANKRADIDALAKSIAAHGLLHNLSVTPRDKDRFEVVAGGRRLAALKSLAVSGAIEKSYAVPCRVLSPEECREASLAENVHRVAMDAMDEVDAFAALIAEGRSEQEIAQRFGVDLRHVQQRLALSGLSPKIKAAWKRGEVTLAAAKAFCLNADHAAQDAVFRQFSKPISHAASVRARLMEGRLRATDRLVRFVGLPAYEAAGGAIVRDLFDEDAVFISDPGLVARLVEERLSAVEAELAVDGWGWVEQRTDTLYVDANGFSRLTPSWRDPTEEEQKELDRLAKELEELDDELETSAEEDDARWDRRDDLAAAIETIRQAARIWDPALKHLAGVIVTVDREGEVQTWEGLVRRSDQKEVDRIRRSSIDVDAHEEDHGETAAGSDTCRADACQALPKALARELTHARTRALRSSLAQDQHAALAVCVTALAKRAFRRETLSGVDVAAHSAAVDDLDDLTSRRDALERSCPGGDGGDSLEWALSFDVDQLLDALAILVAGAVDLTHENCGPHDFGRQAVADRLAMALNLDMTEHWIADAAYWTRLTKATLLSELAEAPSMEALSDKARTERLADSARLKKDKLAERVEEAFHGTGYLPDILVTPVSAGQFEMTEPAEAVIAAE